MIKSRKKIDNQIEKQILTGMIISNRFLRNIRQIYDPKLIQISFVKTVAGWCLDYYQQYEKAPRQHIQDIFNHHARHKLDEDQAELISDFLKSISKEHQRAKKFNSQYLLDQANKRFKTKSLHNLKEDIEAELSNGNVEEAELLLSQYKRVEIPSNDGINPFINHEAIYNAFEEDRQPLFTFPGALGQLLNNELVRDAFIGLMGPEKRGKTFWLMEFGLRAFRARCNVAFFQVGDMSKSQMIRRKLIRLVGKSDQAKYCGEILVPILDCRWNQDDSCRMKKRTCRIGIKNDEGDLMDFEDAPDNYSPCTYCQKKKPRKFSPTFWHKIIDVGQPLTWREGLRKGRALMKRLKGRDYKMSTHPNRTVNVQNIKSQLEIWENFEGFIPDVIIVDYADILAPEDPKKDFRNQQNETWQALRALSLEKHCLVVTATQADAASYEAGTLKLKHFSEDKRKYGQVTVMISLNQTEEEKKQKLMRLGILLMRDGDFDSSNTVKVLQCLEMGRPYLDSYW